MAAPKANTIPHSVRRKNLIDQRLSVSKMSVRSTAAPGKSRPHIYRRGAAPTSRPAMNSPKYDSDAKQPSKFHPSRRHLL
jgi:hypothetical protein